MGEISLINYLLLIFQKTRKKQDIINITQTGGNNVDNKILFVKLQNYLRISNRRGSHMPLGKKSAICRKMSNNSPLTIFQLECIINSWQELKTVKFLLSTVALLFPKGKLVSVVLYSLCHVKQISFMSKTGNNKEAKKKKNKIVTIPQYLHTFFKIRSKAAKFSALCNCK